MEKTGAPVRITGINAVAEAVAAGKARVVFYRAPGSPRVARVIDEARRLGVRLTPMDERQLQRLFRDSKQGIAAEADPVEITNFADLLNQPAEGIILALDHWEDPQNFGSVLRSAAAFGVKAVLFPVRRAVPITPAVYTASAGYIYRVRLVEVRNLRYAVEALKERGWWAVGLSADAPEDLAEETVQPPAVIVVGAEGRGLSEVLARALDLRARIPMAAGVNSLNAGVSAAIALYLAQRAATRKTNP